MLSNATIQHPHGREGQLDAKSKPSHPRRWRQLATQLNLPCSMFMSICTPSYFELPFTSS